MTEKFNREQKQFGVTLSPEQVISLVKHFKLVAQTNKNTLFLEENFQQPVKTEDVFIVPSMLPIKLPF